MAKYLVSVDLLQEDAEHLVEVARSKGLSVDDLFMLFCMDLNDPTEARNDLLEKWIDEGGLEPIGLASSFVTWESIHGTPGKLVTFMDRAREEKALLQEMQEALSGWPNYPIVGGPWKGKVEGPEEATAQIHDMCNEIRTDEYGADSIYESYKGYMRKELGEGMAFTMEECYEESRAYLEGMRSFQVDGITPPAKEEVARRLSGNGFSPVD